MKFPLEILTDISLILNTWVTLVAFPYYSSNSALISEVKIIKESVREHSFENSNNIFFVILVKHILVEVKV